MRVLGIDPGMRITGYACVHLTARAIEANLIEAGVLSFKRTDSMEQRLQQMHEEVCDLIEQLKPEHVAVEKLYAHYRHPRTAILMAHARGVILLAATQAQLPIEHLPATEIKKAVTGNGHASKRQVQLAVQSQCRLSEPPSPPDVADAIAIALCSARRLAMQQLSRQANDA